MRSLAVILVVAALSCGSPLGPLIDGQPYQLARINGEPLPWTSPISGGVPITEGWIKLIDNKTAQRHERAENGASVSDWTVSGRYTLRFGVLIIDYRQPGPLPPSLNMGPTSPVANVNAVDTFYVSGNGLVLRERGYIAPLDSMVRYYVRP
jgi:hypothetical protein